MSNSNIMSVPILFMAIHVSLSVVPASASTPAASAPYVEAQGAVQKSLARAKDMVGLLTRVRKELGNAMELSGLDDCIKLAGVCVKDLTAVNSELAKGEGQLNPKRAGDIVARMNGVVTNEDTCLLGLPEESSNARLSEVIDNLIMTDNQFAYSLEIVTKALKH